MIIPTDIIHKVHHTLDFEYPSRATRDTCNILDSRRSLNCSKCPVTLGDNQCGFDSIDNVNLIESFKLFYNKYPEYLI